MSYLDELLDSTRARVSEARAKITADVLEQRVASAEPPRGFARALTGEGVALIAEIKRRSPARGALALDVDAGPLATRYVAGGAAAISVLTEPDHFAGSLEDLEAARGAGAPVLRKDFVVDEWQVLESRAWGADALLVIVRAVDDETLARLVAATAALGMDALVEVHDRVELERALDAGAAIIGVNHRDLATFEMHEERTLELVPHVPADRTLVALSGVSERGDVERLGEAGVHAVLVGESVVTAPDPAAKLRELRGVA